MARTRSGGSIALIIIGAISALIGLAALGGGGGILILDAVTADEDGFLTSGDVTLDTETSAIVSEDLDVWADAGPDDWTPRVGDVSIRLEVTPTGDRPVFLGIAPTDDVAAYLDDVDHDVLTRLDPEHMTRVEGGEATPAPPGELDIWAAQASGADTQTLTWDLERGTWTVVLMHTDASPGLQVVASGGVRVPFLVPIGIGLLVLAALAITLAVVLLVAGAATATGAGATGEAGEPRPTAARAGTPYPLAVEAHLDPDLSRWQWLVKWFLAIPHMIVLAFLWAAFIVLTIVAGFAILFTGRYPRGIFDFNVGVLRWTWRVTYYAFGVLGTDQYPPFTLRRTDHPADLDVAYPEEGLSRGLVLVKWWLLAIPHYLVVAILTGGIVTWTADLGRPEGWELTFGGGLIGVLSLVAVVVLLFSGRYPRGLFDLTMGLQRWVWRVTAYVSLMTDVYPPFRLDPGGSEPTSQAPPPPTAPTGDATADRPTSSTPA